MGMRKLHILKFGGTSVGNLERINKVADIVAIYKRRKQLEVVVVVSAMGDTTDNLIELAKKVNPSPPERELDMLISTGEQVSGALLAMALHKKGIEAISFTGPQVGIITDVYHTKAKVLKIERERIEKELEKGKVVIVAGFQGVTPEREITTLGRGGSDLSAVALGVSLGAEICEIYTDVEGIFTADPRIVPEAVKIECITFDEMLELAAKGAQVLQTRAVELAKKFNLSLHVRSSFTKKEGTIIMEKKSILEEPVVRGIALATDEVKITVCNVPDRPGVAAHLFEPIAEEGINVDMIVQNVSHRKVTDISFTVNKNDAHRACAITKKVAKGLGAGRVVADEDIAKVSIVGVGMRSHSGVAAAVFKALAKNKINIEMISTSEINISCVVRKEEGEVAVNILHKAFGLGSGKKQTKNKRKK